MAARTAPGCGQQYGSVCHVRCQTAPTIAQRPARHRAAVSGSQRQEGPLDWQQPRGQQDELHRCVCVCVRMRPRDTWQVWRAWCTHAERHVLPPPHVGAARSQHAPVPAAIPASHGGDPAPKDAAEGVADSRQRRQPPHANEKQPQPQGAWLLDPLTTDILSIALPVRRSTRSPPGMLPPRTPADTTAPCAHCQKPTCAVCRCWPRWAPTPLPASLTPPTLDGWVSAQLCRGSACVCRW
jgi:hypothetical protein